MKKRSLLKKSAAIICSAALTVTGSASLVLAADSYQAAEKDALARTIESVGESYQQDLDTMSSMMSQGTAQDLSINLTDEGKSLVGSLVEMDLSWLSNIGLNLKGSFSDSVEAAEGYLYLNDANICSLQTYLDLANLISYTKVPEVCDAFLKTDLTAADETAYEDEEDDTSIDDEFAEEVTSPEDLALLMELYSNPEAFMPSAEVLQTLLDRYGNILISHFNDTEAAQETITAGGVSQDCTALVGHMYQADAQEMILELLETAKNDAELKALLESWNELTTDSEDLYAEFIDALDEAYASMREAEADETDTSSYIFSEIWVDEDGMIVGRQIGFIEENESTPFFTYYAPKADGQSGLMIEIGDSTDNFTVSGSGTVTDNILDGNYVLGMSGSNILNVAVSGYDTQAAAEGKFAGNYTLTLDPGCADAFGDTTYSMLADFALTLGMTSDAETANILLSVTYGGVDLGNLTWDIGVGSPVEVPDFATLENVLDMADETDMETYNTSIDPTQLLENLTGAGMPEEVLYQLLGISDSSEDVTTYEESVESYDGTDTEASAEADTETAE